MASLPLAYVPAIHVLTQRAVDRKDVDARNIWREDALPAPHDETLQRQSITAIIQRAEWREPGKSGAAFSRTKSRREGAARRLSRGDRFWERGLFADTNSG